VLPVRCAAGIDSRGKIYRPKLGAKVGANMHRHGAVSDDVQRASSQVDATPGDAGLRLATE